MATQFYCPTCNSQRFRPILRQIAGPILALLLAGGVSCPLMILAVNLGGVWLLGGAIGLVIFLGSVIWFVRQRYIYQCLDCGQKVSVNPFGMS